MKQIFKKGDKKSFKRIVQAEDVAAFEGVVVHPVCSTFALARDMEWSSRLFVLEMKEADEEGIGTMLSIDHQSPALQGDELTFEAEVNKIEENEVICNITVKAGDRLVATGKTGQKVLKKEKIDKIFNSLGTTA